MHLGVRKKMTVDRLNSTVASMLGKFPRRALERLIYAVKINENLYKYVLSIYLSKEGNCHCENYNFEIRFPFSFCISKSIYLQKESNKKRLT